MTAVVNGFSINGKALTSWVVRAVVVATAAAAVASSEPTRITYATSYGDAAVVVSLTQTHTIQARATGTAFVSYRIEPTTQFAGSSIATVTATGNGAVLRDVWATAGGDATCTASALTAQSIGDAQATAVSTVDLALAHIIHPGRSITLCEASIAASGDVTRYAVAFLDYGHSGPSWGEASVRRNGNNYFEHDGYSLDNSTASFLIANDLTSTIVTQPIIASMQCIGESNAFLIQPAQCIGIGSILNQSASAQSIQSKYGIINATSESTALAYATINITASAESYSSCIKYIINPIINYTASASWIDAQSSYGVGDALRTAFSGVRELFCNAYLIESTYGIQLFSDAKSTTSNSAKASALQHFIAYASAVCSCVAAEPIYGIQHYAYVSDSGLSAASMPRAIINYSAKAYNSASLTLIQSKFGTNHKATATATGNCKVLSGMSVIASGYKWAVNGLSINGTAPNYYGVSVIPPDEGLPFALINRYSNVNSVISIVGRAYAIANSEINAPDDRYMIVGQEDRAMVVFAEDRMMVA